MVNGLVLHGGAEPVWTQWIVIWCCKWTTVDANTVWSSVWSSSCKCIEVGWGQHGGLSTKVQSCWNILWTAALIVTSSLVDLMSDPLSTLQCLSYVHLCNHCQIPAPPLPPLLTVQLNVRSVSGRHFTLSNKGGVRLLLRFSVWPKLGQVQHSILVKPHI